MKQAPSYKRTLTPGHRLEAAVGAAVISATAAYKLKALVAEAAVVALAVAADKECSHSKLQ